VTLHGFPLINLYLRTDLVNMPIRKTDPDLNRYSTAPAIQPAHPYYSPLSRAVVTGYRDGHAACNISENCCVDDS